MIVWNRLLKKLKRWSERLLNRTMKRYFTHLIIILACLGSQVSLAQHAPKLSKAARVYMLYVAPGPDMYAVYGHSALWVSDEIVNVNNVYDYGVFDFESPHFYTNFLMGNMRYNRTQRDINSFVMPFYIQERPVSAKQIFLDSIAKQRLFDFLWNNAQPGHDTYHYDFVKDNCATQLKHLMDSASYGQIKWNYYSDRQCLRTLLYEDMESMYWTKFGYGLLLGAGADTLLDHSMENFLPQYLFRNLGNAGYRNADLSGPNEPVLNVTPTWVIDDIWYGSPAVVFGLILLGMLALVYWLKIPKAVDVVWFLVIGILGCIIFFMSNFTAHHVMKHNWNLLWTHPFFLIWPFVLGFLHKKGVRRYGQLLCFGLTIAVVAYPVLPQTLPPESLLINITSLILITYRLYPRFYQKIRQWRK